jgi:hemerythrin
MPFMVWNDKLSIHVAAVDGDHKKMIAIINELYDGIVAGVGNESLGLTMDGLIAYSRYHFAREEELFAMTGYEDADAHKKEHDCFSARVMDIQKRLRNGAIPAPSLEVMVFLKDWLFDHIIGYDLKLGPHLNATGIH